jgi:electron transport complex protein RnfG
MLLRAILRHGALLALFALVATAAIALTWVNTREEIAEQQRRFAARALLEVVPARLHDNDLLDDTVAVRDPEALHVAADARIHIARRDGEPVAAVLPVAAPDGYSGRIELIVGVDRSGRITGVRVLQHRETPGLGDRVELRKSDWVLDFEGRALGDPPAERWTVRKDGGAFDQFTGATITPRAVVAAVREALEYHQAHLAEYFAGKETADG